ncbi:pantoate--beta-alanine ligase [Rhodopirellula baltica SH28]|uniref:Pantothenate synthetase n=1 Tax=Rhodopirellula baltica SH28 TaxID=993517 RepID=K5C8X0_RHOBT|nr:pantoate--beta-alanine ligase [Rhodopirellula baltica]EKJ99509.1 pantoate--beta-alanine ligase [Rhodopirellula baltica SH28]
METFTSIDAMRAWCREKSRGGNTIGLVPTMGALHDGHLSLVHAAKKDCDHCVTSIFVNPTQFAANEDLDQYPRPIEDDLAMLRDAGVEAVFMPTADEMYPGGPQTHATSVHPSAVALPLEGVHRPEHFVGVATVVMKLFQAAPSDRAFFGRKDFQQLCVIEHMVRDLNLPIEIVPCDIVREPDGLAMSSRNRYLSDDQRQRALCISKSLNQIEQAFLEGNYDPKQLESIMADHLSPCDSVDYAVVVDRQTLLPISEITQNAVALVAVRVGVTRLIDNRELIVA